MSKDDWGARLQGRCPSCGSETLFRGSNGYITCSLLGCKNPAAAYDLLSGKPPLFMPEQERAKCYDNARGETADEAIARVKANCEQTR